MILDENSFFKRHQLKTGSINTNPLANGFVREYVKVLNNKKRSSRTALPNGTCQGVLTGPISPTAE